MTIVKKNALDDSRSKLRHPIGEPGRHTAAVQRQVRNPGTLHASIVSIPWPRVLNVGVLCRIIGCRHAAWSFLTHAILAIAVTDRWSRFGVASHAQTAELTPRPPSRGSSGRELAGILDTALTVLAINPSLPNQSLTDLSLLNPKISLLPSWCGRVFLPANHYVHSTPD